MSRLFGSVRSRATLGATLVVAVALVAAGAAVLLSLRANLTGEAGTRAERSAQAVASELAARIPLDKLSGLDAEDVPVQIVDEDGVLLAASEDLERISGTGTAEVTPAPTRSGADDDRDRGTTTATTTPAARATTSPSNPARSPRGRATPTAPPPSTGTPRTTASPP